MVATLYLRNKARQIVGPVTPAAAATKRTPETSMVGGGMGFRCEGNPTDEPTHLAKMVVYLSKNSRMLMQEEEEEYPNSPTLLLLLLLLPLRCSVLLCLHFLTHFHNVINACAC